MAINNISLALLGLACIGHARHVQTRLLSQIAQSELPINALVEVLLAFHPQGCATVNTCSRRALLFSPLIAAPLAARAADDEATIVKEIKEIKEKLDVAKINALIDDEQWDAVRSILKVPPVNNAWEQSQAKKNPVKKLVDLRDDVELFDLVEELAGALQLADQYCYSNTFIYTQPGSGKVKFKEPKQQIAIAIEKIDTLLR
jgi:hypothetical protein